MVQDVVNHKSKGVFDGVAEEVPTTLVTERSSEHTVGLNPHSVRLGAALKLKKWELLAYDVWERVDLVKVGIPLPTQENVFKVVFTTRSIKVCGQMEAHKIPVQCLPKEKAWELFQEKVGAETLDSSPRIRQLAHEVAKECQGLPLALITIACAMAFKRTVEEWTYALVVLRRSSISIFQDMGEEVYPLLKFSYDSLRITYFENASCTVVCSQRITTFQKISF
ncbi:hypothetical protein REPUB_Repub08aG0011400 [Reevesia pubescens]